MNSNKNPFIIRILKETNRFHKLNMLKEYRSINIAQINDIPSIINFISKETFNIFFNNIFSTNYILKLLEFFFEQENVFTKLSHSDFLLKIKTLNIELANICFLPSYLLNLKLFTPYERYRLERDWIFYLNKVILSSVKQYNGKLQDF